MKHNLLRAGVLAAGLVLADPSAVAQTGPVIQEAESGIALGVGKGTLVRLPRAVTDVFVANDKIADVQVKSSTHIYVFGISGGETSLYATDAGGKVVYSANVRVAQNIDQIKSMLGMTMPAAAIEVTPMNGLVLLTGTVANPSEVEEATRLTQAFVGEKTTVVTKLKTAMPVQVNLQVKIAEVSRGLLKELGVNLLSRDIGSGFGFGISRGRNIGTIAPTDFSRFPKVDASGLYGLPANSLSLPFDPATGQFLVGGTSYNFVNPATANTTFNLAGKLFGLDLAAAIDALEQDGVVSVLAEPNLTALSGETASFLAGGEFPIPTLDTNGGVDIQFKEYGVGLAFTPTVLDGNRISMRVRPEVSELTDDGAVRLNNFVIPALTTRRAETTVELGSGQSFMIAGLLRNRTNTSTDKTPLLGDLPIIGALFKSDRFQRNETELVIVITPYLVKPMNAAQVRLPTDGYQAPTDLQRWLLGKTFDGKSANTRPQPTVVEPARAAPAAAAPVPATPAQPAPGFALN
ncbi:type II and III secretion system protein family protein [Sphingoaurantiacus capsulatus]|uniref:Type II and III secretion system protein family protein n=1 Tax=Sphingoaurantiacus capsulatus TaxID=1771310 RepID=A0ABV7X732_9SPHN